MIDCTLARVAYLCSQDETLSRKIRRHQPLGEKLLDTSVAFLVEIPTNYHCCWGGNLDFRPLTFGLCALLGSGLGIHFVDLFAHELARIVHLAQPFVCVGSAGEVAVDHKQAAFAIL